jgi:hypothetical protein
MQTLASDPCARLRYYRWASTHLTPKGRHRAVIIAYFGRIHALELIRVTRVY